MKKNIDGMHQRGARFSILTIDMIHAYRIYGNTTLRLYNHVIPLTRWQIPQEI